MRMSIAVLSLTLCANLALAQWNNIQGSHRLSIGRELLARQSDGDCTTESTCSECYGSGYVLCSNAGCFNPSLHQQCCSDGSYCVAADSSCCGSLSAGVTGTDGAVPASAYSAYYSSLATSTPTSIPCTSSDSNEACCQKLGSDISWCSGDYPNQTCYNPSEQSCCSNGIACSGDNCCSLVSATATTPNPVEATEVPSSVSSSAASTIAPTTVFNPSSSVSTTASASSSTGGGNSLDSMNILGFFALLLAL